MKAIVISTVGASNTGAGGPVGVYGNVACLNTYGFETYNIAICEEGSIAKCDFPIIYIDSKNESESSIIELLQNHIDGIKPDVIWLHHYWVWKYYKKLDVKYPLVLLSGDPDWELEILRQKTRLKSNNLIKRLYHYILHLRKIDSLKREESKVFKEVVAKSGVIACWCPSSVKDLELRLSMKVHSCPLAFPDWGITKGDITGSLLMLGNLNGGHSRMGVAYFLKSVWPVFKKLAETKFLRIRMVGGGKLPESLVLPIDSNIFKRIGFIENLDDEWKVTLATLVPVPIELGFRTRIIESLSKGIPVLAHPSAKASLIELESGKNYLSFSNGAELVDQATRLRSNKALYNRLVLEGRRMFEENYSVEAGALRFGKLSELAMKNRNTTDVIHNS